MYISSIKLLIGLQSRGQHAHGGVQCSAGGRTPYFRQLCATRCLVGAGGRLPGRRLFVHFCFGIFSFPAHPGSPGMWVVGEMLSKNSKRKLFPSLESDPSALRAAGGDRGRRAPCWGQPAQRLPALPAAALRESRATGYMVALALLNSLASS